MAQVTKLERISNMFCNGILSLFSSELLYTRPFDTISDFSISKLKWCPNHMDYKFKEFSGPAFLSLANRPSEV